MIDPLSGPVRVFSNIYNTGAWMGEVPSGPGSTLKATALLRPQLERVFRELAITSLVDAPCGDGTWIAEITGSLDRYQGFDVVSELIEGNNARQLPRHSFGLADIIEDKLPRADAILCRDCLVHLPLDAAVKAIERFKASGSTFLIATTFTEHVQNIEAQMGGWRPLNLTLPPFNLPPPIRLINERLPNLDDKYNDKALGVWRLADIFPEDMLERPRTVFFTVAVGKYKMFAVPYIYSVLRSNPDAAVEILMDGAQDFVKANQAAFDIIGRRHRIVIRDIDVDPGSAPYVRFLAEPITRTRYVYIGDVDILVLDSDITRIHAENARKLGLPFSNIVRASGGRLTGLHFTEREAYYPIAQLGISDLRTLGDEQLLYKLVEARGFGMPTGVFRPIHGIHMSPNRATVVNKADPGRSWGINPIVWEKYLALANDPQWTSLLPLFDPDYRAALDHMATEWSAAQSVN